MTGPQTLDPEAASAAASITNGLPTQLATKLAGARRSAKAIAKQGENKAQGYNYVRAEDVIAEAQRVLNRRKIIVTPSIDHVEFIPTQTGRGAAAQIAVVSMTYLVIDTDTGEQMVRTWAGTGWDSPGDKALYKAITGGTKYFYAALLGIPFGEDPEDDETDPPNGRHTKPAAEPPPHAKPDQPIDGKRVRQIGQRIGTLGLTYKEIDLIMGACGADGLRASSKLALRERLETLDDETATKVEGELERRADASD